MAGKQISDLTPATGITDGSLFVIEQGGAAKNINWNALKSTLPALSDSFIDRGYLLSGADCDTINIGEYTKDGGVSILHGVNVNRAVIVCFTPISRGVALAQLWFDLPSENIYYRSKRGASDPWTDWTRIISTSNMVATKKLYMPIHSVSDGASGKWASGTGNLTRSRSTPNRYKVKGATKVVIEWTPSGNDSLLIFRYDSSGDFLGYLTANTSPYFFSGYTTTEYIALSIYSSVNNVIPDPNVTISAYGIPEIVEVKNPSFGSNIAGTRWYRFGYSVGEYEDSGGNLVNNVNTGMIMLPPNYTFDGKPVAVIIMVHGSEAYKTIAGTQNPNYETFYNFLADCGYALIDCYGWTKRYDGNGTGLHNPWPIPTTERAYESLVKLCLQAFNLDGNNMFVMCKSLGGRMCEWIAANMKVNAAGFLAPALRCYFGYANSKYRTIMVEDMGLKGVVNADIGWATEADCLTDFVSNFTSWSSAKREAFYVANESAIMGVDPEFTNLTGATAAEKLMHSAKGDFLTSEYNRVAFAPSKVWFAEDDDSISPTACYRFTQQIRNGGGYAVDRVMPNGTGGHHSVDTDANAPQKTSVTTPLGYTYASVPLAYYELWEFFERFRR